MSNQLKKIIITRTSDGWQIARERESNGESGVFPTLDEAFDFVRALYDEYGEMKQIGLFNETT